MPFRRAASAVVLLGCVSFLLLTASADPEAGPPSETDPHEVAVRLIALHGDWERAEFSGLAWRDDDWLLLLPQWPDRFADSTYSGHSTFVERSVRGASRLETPRPDGYLFAADEDEVEDAAKGKRDEPLSLHPVALFAPGVAASIPGFQGYESIAVVSDSAYLTVEAEADGFMHGYLVAGVFETDDDGRPAALRLDRETITEIPSPDRPDRYVNLDNLTYEALVATPSSLFAIYEANGQSVGPFPRSYVFDHLGQLERALPFPVLEYRVTDATDIDEDGYFWVLNTYWPGDELLLRPAADSLALRYGQGPTHAQSKVVERLVELQLTGNGVRRTKRAPVQLRLLSQGAARNWEGVVRLEDDGFLVITDSYPGTMLGFVDVSL